jgi:hypothetical protein
MKLLNLLVARNNNKQQNLTQKRQIQNFKFLIQYKLVFLVKKMTLK